jgi:hypothetical protein
MEYVLSLAEALERVPDKPPEHVLRFAASSFLVPLEYQIIRRTPCPRCASTKWKYVVQAALPSKEGQDWPYFGPAGDEHQCGCEGCGHALTFTFRFTR